MSRKKKEIPVLNSESDFVSPKRVIKSFKPKKDIVLSPGFEIRKTASSQRWPGGKQWRKFFKVLSRIEKLIFGGLLFVFLASLAFICLGFYYRNTEAVPTNGGKIIEGFVSQPRFINPIYANSDVDRDLSELIFSGLMKYDREMQIIPDLAADYPEIEDEGRIYKFYLKENIFWQDGTLLTADDVIFTIKTIQNAELKSPYLANWIGIKAEKISEFGIRFTLQKPYSAFVENCTTKIIPKHIWEGVSVESFPFQPQNLEKAVGSGMYRIKEIKRDNATQKIEFIDLKKNDGYFDKKPYISEIRFEFFDSREELVQAAEKGKITSFDAGMGQIDNGGWEESHVYLPRYFALFFNLDRKEALKDKNIRKALSYGTNKKELSPNLVDSPIIPNFYGIPEATEKYTYNPEEAGKLFKAAGYEDSDGNGVLEKTTSKEPAFQFKSRLTVGSSGKEVSELQKCLKMEETGYFGQQTKSAVIAFQEEYADEVLIPAGYSKGTGIVGESTKEKLNQICFGDPDEVKELGLNIVTVDQLRMKEIAEIIKSQWEELGVKVNVEAYPILQLEQEFIKSRNYDILLFGEVLGAIPDPFPFWHSSQKYDPGSNLSCYENQEVDTILEENRKISDETQRKENLARFQELIMQDIPAIFLYSPEYSHLISKKIKGVADKKAIGISKRFVDIENWHIKTRRVWK